MSVVLIDTSSWVAALRRKSDPIVKDRVSHLLRDGLAAWCPVVQVELWNGISSIQERNRLKELSESIILLPMEDEVWQAACELGTNFRSKGLVVPATDLMIFACARHYGTPLEHCDRHYELMYQMVLD